MHKPLFIIEEQLLEILIHKFNEFAIDLCISIGIFFNFEKIFV